MTVKHQLDKIDKEVLKDVFRISEGGPGSGNFGHEGRPGLVGGSGDGGSSPSAEKLSGSLPWGRKPVQDYDIFKYSSGRSPSYGVHTSYIKPKTSQTATKVIQFAKDALAADALSWRDASSVRTLVDKYEEATRYGEAMGNGQPYEVESHLSSSFSEATDALTRLAMGYYKKKD